VNAQMKTNEKMMQKWWYKHSKCDIFRFYT